MVNVQIYIYAGDSTRENQPLVSGGGVKCMNGMIACANSGITVAN